MALQKSEIQKELEGVLGAYFRAGQSNSGSCFDPYAGYLMEEARKKAKAFLEKLAGLLRE